MAHNKTQNVMSLMGGALLGAAAMYLLDPDMGQRRRKYVRKQAGEYLESAGDTLQGGWQHLGEHARSVGATLSDKAQDYGQRLADVAQDYGDRLSAHARDAGLQDVGSDWTRRARRYGSTWAQRMRGLGSMLSGHAHDLTQRGGKLFGHYTDKASDIARDYAGSASDAADDITDYGNRLWKQVRHLGDRVSGHAEDLADAAAERASSSGEHSSAVVPITATAVGCCAIGAAVMYLMDPQRGRSRRSWLANKVTSMFHHTGRSAYQTGRHLANRAYGVAHETQQKFYPSGPISSEQLLARVRSAMGREVSHPRMVQVMTDANGAVTLSGVILANESDRLIAAIEAVPGVSLVVNQLRTVNSEQDMTREWAASPTRNPVAM